MTSTIVPNRETVVTALSQRAADILARHGYPERPLTGEIGLGLLPIAYLPIIAALASSPTPDGVIKDKDGRRPNGPGLSPSVGLASDPAGFAASIPGAGQESRIEALESALRGLASYLGVGGYNAPTVDPDVFDRKIRDGIDTLSGPFVQDAARYRKLRMVGAAPNGTLHLEEGVVYVTTNLDAWLDHYLDKGYPPAPSHAVEFPKGLPVRARDQRAEREDAQRPRPEAASPVVDANSGGEARGLSEAVAAYLAARDAEPEKDCWDTDTGDEEPGAQRFASDWAWQDHHDRVAAALARLREVFAAPRPSQREG